ncbi:SDR family oxidoreductase [Exiguobacterium sp. s22]|uniref:SDR family oxidoreductase n=1 Tax=Exiguobacterium sp. s22 TaxID=2751272 RepID=UPI001BE7D95F|nr:SDR family oxidoreductase [Exiguobacterium sp. s22]
MRNEDKKVIVITGASSGFGALTARALSQEGHVVYAGMRETLGRNAPRFEEAIMYAERHHVDLHPIEMDVSSQHSVDNAIQTILLKHREINVVIHNAGHMVVGPTEAFTPEQLANMYDTNVVSTQRVNRAVLPHMRSKRNGLLIWVSSSSVKGGTPPYLAPYFAAKAGMDSLAVSYAAELIRFGIETSIIVPGSFTSGTNHFLNAGVPTDTHVQREYEEHYAGLMEQVGERLSALAPEDADVSMVVREIVKVVALPKGSRPFRVHIDPVDDGSERVSSFADEARQDFLTRIGLSDLITL